MFDIQLKLLELFIGLLKAPTVLAAYITGSLTVLGVVFTGIVTILAVFLRDFLIATSLKEKETAQLQYTKVMNYVDPLHSAASKLFWRFKEIFSEDGRGVYLTASAPTTEFNIYKIRSTLYRLASLLGWIRAFRKEMSYLSVADQKQFQALQMSIDSLEGALAEGIHAEQDRLRYLNDRWNLKLASHSKEFKRISVSLDSFLDSRSSEGTIQDNLDLPLCQDVADFISQQLNQNKGWVIGDAVPSSRLHPRQAWLYRDWQEVIGEMMVQPAENASRRFDVASYGEFEKMCFSADDDLRRPLRRLMDLVDRVDFSSQTDYRPQQLWNCYQATANLVLALGKIGRKGTDTLCREAEVVSKLASKFALMNQA